MAAVIHNLLKTLFYREYTVYTSRLQTAESSFLLNVWLELGVINSCLTLPPGGQRAVLYIFFFFDFDYAWAQPVMTQNSVFLSVTWKYIFSLFCLRTNRWAT